MNLNETSPDAVKEYMLVDIRVFSFPFLLNIYIYIYIYILILPPFLDIVCLFAGPTESTQKLYL